MVAPEREPLKGEVKIDEFFLGGYEEGLRGGRQRGKKVLCGVSLEHLLVYLDEFVFRHNRRGTPMADFQTLLGLGLAHEPITYRQIIDRAA